MPVEVLSEIVPMLLEFFDQYGVAAMFVMLVIDGAIFFPIPGEAIMVMAVSRFAHSVEDLIFITSLATLAGILGSLILYTVSRIGGRPLVEKHPRLFMMDRRRREKLESTFENPLGQSLVCFLRIIPLTRIVVNIPAGLARMGAVRFLVLSSIGLAAFHGGFMWLAWESQQAGSPVAQELTSLQETYGTPMWQYVQAHEIVAIVAALAIGAWLSFRSSRRMMKHPRGALTSILGWLTVRVLVFGTLALWGALVYDPQIVYDLAFAGGLDVEAIALKLGIEPVRTLAYAGVITWSVGMVLWGLEGVAKSRRAEAEARADRDEDELPEPELEPVDASGS
jgi:membrane protein DedA with SNARE-associated domain